MIEAGEKLLSALNRSQVKVRSAFWFYAIRLSRSAIGNTLIEDALIYRST